MEHLYRTIYLREWKLQEKLDNEEAVAGSMPDYYRVMKIYDQIVKETGGEEIHTVNDIVEKTHLPSHISAPLLEHAVASSIEDYVSHKKNLINWQ